MRTIIGLAVAAAAILVVVIALVGPSAFLGQAPKPTPVAKGIARADPASAVQPAPGAAGETAPAPAAAKPRPPLCMSDVEVKAYARFAAYGPIAYGAESCRQRFPDLSAEIDKDVAALSARHGATLDDVREAALQPFTRSFGPDGAKKRDARADADNASTFQRIRAYSRDECKSHIAALEGFGTMSAEDFGSVLDTLVRQTIDGQRKAVPVCG